jgi:hypothetical protein
MIDDPESDEDVDGLKEELAEMLDPKTCSDQEIIDFIKSENKLSKATSKTTIQQYVNLYAGPEFLIYSQYSFALVLIYTTFLYGLFLPILFPICLLGLFNMQLVDNLALTYYYQKPPMYSDAMNKRAYDILVMAPILMFVFGYWALSNSQIFSNTPPDRMFTNRSPNPKHRLLSFDQGLDQGIMALVILGFWTTKVFFDILCKPCMDKMDMCKKGEEEDDADDEGLPTYWKAIPGHL